MRFKLHLHSGEELALVIGARQFHAVDLDRSVPACGDGDVDFVLQVEPVRHFLTHGFAAVPGVGNQSVSARVPSEVALVAGPAFLVARLFLRGNRRHHGLYGLLDLFVGQVVVQQNTGVVDEHSLEVGVVEEFLEHSSRCAAVGYSPASASESAPHAALAGVLRGALFGAEHPVEHILVLHIKVGYAGGESESVVGVEGNVLEGISVAAPGAHVVVWPVAVVEVHFGEHVLGKAVHVHLGLKLFVLLVVFAGVIGA